MIPSMLARTMPWALIAAVAIAGLQTYRLAREQGAHAGTQHRHAEQLRALEQAAREAVTNARAEEARRYTTLMEIADDAQTQLARARADAAGAADAAGRLRQRIATLAAGRCPAARDTAASSSGTAADTAPDLLADLQRRLDDAADGIARHADEARIAGGACERSYDALIEPQSAPDDAAVRP